MHLILERVKIDLDEDEIRRLIDAVDHYEAYLHLQQRHEEKFRELLVRLRKMLDKRTQGHLRRGRVAAYVHESSPEGQLRC